MNLGILLLGLIGGTVVGGGLYRQSIGAQRRRHDILTRGAPRSVTVAAVTTTGRFAEWRRVQASTDDGDEFTVTLAALQATQLGLQVGATVDAIIVPGEPGMGEFAGAAAQPHGRGVAVAAGLLIAALGLAAAVVT